MKQLSVVVFFLTINDNMKEETKLMLLKFTCVVNEI